MSGIGEFSEEKRRGNCRLLRRKCILLLCGRTIGGQSTGACPSLGFSWVGTWWLQYSQLNSWCLSVDPAPAPKAPELTFLAPHMAHRKRCEFGAMGLEVMSTTVGTGLCPDLPVLLSQHQRPKLRSRCLHCRCASTHPGTSSSRKLRSPWPGCVQAPGAGTGLGQHGARDSPARGVFPLQGKGTHPVPSLAGVDAALGLPVLSSFSSSVPSRRDPGPRHCQPLPHPGQ